MANGFLRKIMLPKEDKFFPLFEEMAELISISAAILTSIIDHQEPHNQLDSFAEIKAAEKRTGEIVHRALEMVNSTFITPFEKEDMQLLLVAMDDVISLINSTGQEIKLYKPVKPFPQCRQMAMVSDVLMTIIIKAA